MKKIVTTFLLLCMSLFHIHSYAAISLFQASETKSGRSFQANIGIGMNTLGLESNREDQHFTTATNISLLYNWNSKLDMILEFDKDQSEEKDGQLSMNRKNQSLALGLRLVPFVKNRNFFLGSSLGVIETRDKTILTTRDYQGSQATTDVNYVQKNMLFRLGVGFNYPLSLLFESLGESAWRLESSAKLDFVLNRDYLNSIGIKVLGLGYQF